MLRAHCSVIARSRPPPASGSTVPVRPPLTIPELSRPRRELQVGDPGYGGMVLRALLFSTVISLQFELWPLSDASIGNVGMRDPNTIAWGDLVITPALGVAWMVSEDVIDAQILKRMDGQQIVLRNTLRFLLNPSRGAANLSRGNWPWYRTRDVDPGRRDPGAP